MYVRTKIKSEKVRKNKTNLIKKIKKNLKIIIDY